MKNSISEITLSSLLSTHACPIPHFKYLDGNLDGNERGRGNKEGES